MRALGSKTLVVVAVLVLAAADAVLAQQTTGTPGSPNATTTLRGKQLPAPNPTFQGVIGRTAPESREW
jgi:arylsulfatase